MPFTLLVELTLTHGSSNDPAYQNCETADYEDGAHDPPWDVWPTAEQKCNSEYDNASHRSQKHGTIHRGSQQDP